MKNGKIPKFLLLVLILTLVILSILLLVIHEKHVLFSIIAVIVLSMIYLGGMERNQRKNLRKHKNEYLKKNRS
jgi:hypothetical protein